MRKKRLHAVTLIVGSIIALAIAFSQFLGPDFYSSAKTSDTEQAGDESGNETDTYISLPSLSLPAPVHVQSGLTTYCLFAIFFEEDVDGDEDDDDHFVTDRFFQTLFRVIISPNAP
ncbi:MAG: hypothetical protein ABIR06_07770 [Cyclobacteriaceae bacterium]